MKDEARNETRRDQHEEPVISGTLFLTSLLLVMIMGFWMLMYLTLVGR